MRRSLVAGGIVLAGILLSQSAIASNLPGPGGANSWTIYAFANTAVLQGILQSASALIANQSFRYFLEFLATVGFLGTVIGLGMFGGDLRRLAWPAIAGTIFLTVGIGTTTNVTIQDTVTTGNIPAVAVVPNVPIIVALPESIVSTMGHQLAYLLDTFYSLPDQLTVTGGSGFNLAAALVHASTKVSIPDPLVRASLASYAQNCIVPSIAAGTLSPYLLTTATQLWGATTAAATPVYPCGGATGTSQPAMMCVNPSLMAVMYSDATPGGIVLPCAMPNGGLGTSSSSSSTCSGGTTGISSTTYNVSCAQTAYDYLNQVFYNGAPNWFQQGAGAWAATGTYSWLGSELTSAESYLFGGALTQSTGGTIEQSAAINAMSPALQAAAMASGQSQMVTSLAVAQAETSQVTSWATAVNLFQDLSGYIYSVLQAFLVAMTPIVIAAAFMPGAGLPMVKSYLKITIWLALWMPVLSIINYIVSLYGTQEMTGVFGSGPGGYSMQSMAPVSQMTEHLVLAGGFLATLTPLITWALVNGSFAFTEFLAEGLGGRMASMAGSMAATGNVSLGNQSFHNTSMNQAMMATTTIAGSQAAQIYSHDGGVQTTLGEGGAIARNPAGIAGSRSASSLDAQGVAQQESITRGATVAANRNEERATAAATQADKTLQSTTGINSDAGTRMSADETKRLSQDVQNQIQYAQNNGVGDFAAAEKAKKLTASGALSPTELLSGLTKILGSTGGKGFKSVGGASSKAEGGVSEGDTLSHRNSAEVSTSTSDRSGNSASLGNSALLAQLRSTIYTAQANAAERVNSSAADQYRSAAGFSQQASESYQYAQQATRRVEQSVGETGVSAWDTTNQAAAASQRVDKATQSAPTIGAPLNAGALTVPGGQLSEQVSRAVPAPSTLPQVDGNAVVVGGIAAQRQAENKTHDAQPALNRASAQLEHFDETKQKYQHGLTNAQETADHSAAGVRGAASGQVAATTARVDLGQDQVKGSQKKNEQAITESTNSANPFNVTPPTGADGFGAQSAVLLGGPTAIKGAAEGAANYELLKKGAQAIRQGAPGPAVAGAEATSATAAGSGSGATAVGAEAASAGTAAASTAGSGTAASAAGASAGAAAAEATGAGTVATGTVTTGTGAVAAEGGLGVAAAPVAVGAAVIAAAGFGSKYLYENNPKYANALNSLYVALGDDPKKYAPMPEPVQLTPSPDLRSAGRLNETSPDKLSDSEAIKTDAIRKEQEAGRR